MPRETRELVVFLASPSDLPDERDAVRRAASAVNDALGRRFGLRLNVQGWEQVQPALGRPQALINPLVDECDVFIGLLNRRWGTPTGTHSSGFLEEFERILVRKDAVHPPRVALFFAQVPMELAQDPGEELKRVLSFQRMIQDEHAALYKSFDGLFELERAVQILFTDVLGEQVADTFHPPASGSSESVNVEPVSTPTEQEDIDDARRQLGSNLAAWADVVSGRPTGSSADRDRLVSFALAVSSDAEVFGTHLANRLYRRRESLAISVAEAHAWVRTLCRDAERAFRGGWDRVIPGWYFFREDAERADLLASFALSEDEAASSGALAILRRTRERPTSLWPPRNGAQGVDGEGVGVPVEGDAGGASPTSMAAANWKILLTRDGTADEAANYLFDLADARDADLLGAITDLLANVPAADALALIAVLRGSAEPAIDLAVQKYRLNDWLRSYLLKFMSSLSSDALVKIASHVRDDDVRCAAFDHLRLPELPAGELTTIAIAMFRGSERTRASLLRRLDLEPESILASVSEAWAQLKPDERRGDLENRLLAAQSSGDELLSRLSPDWSGVNAWVALSLQHPPIAGLADRARSVLREGGVYYDNTQTFPGGADNPEVQRLREFVTGRAREAALRILAAIPPDERDPADRILAREDLASSNWVSKKQALLTLTALAEQEDVPSLIEGAESEYLNGDELEMVLDAAIRLGGTEVARALLKSDNDEPASTAARLLAARVETTEDELVELLYHPADGARAAALASLIERCDDARLMRLLHDYPLRPGMYYYNVMARLDWHLFAQPRVNAN